MRASSLPINARLFSIQRCVGVGGTGGRGEQETKLAEEWNELVELHRGVQSGVESRAEGDEGQDGRREIADRTAKVATRTEKSAESRGNRVWSGERTAASSPLTSDALRVR